MKKVLFVTGASKGIGLEVAVVALEKGYRVVATSRNTETLTEKILARVPAAGSDFLALEMLFTEESIQAAVAQVLDHFGRIDVLVNNAGYGIFGALEEFSLDEIRKNFDVNVFGLLALTQAVLPGMRQQKSGHIINLASISGSVTGPVQGVYSATKASVIMMSEALQAEVEPFGIQVTAVNPTGIRTDFLDSSSMRRPEKEIKDYEVVQATMSGLARLNHNQGGDPTFLAQAILDIAEMKKTPNRFYAGSGALAAMQYKINEVVTEINEFADLSQSVDRKD
ncbi:MULTISPECIES: SDR family NAD(P)-dependent oxidoreductase [unclassified Streptococcus]|uniref:SDR family NAD(P)-dependent oxidoreductase n=1 Tax=unclassified Streptococcus TaxID=2608887 RepID=UPI0010718D22|nr:MULTISPECIES: SDR family NAD(P)-dependent oxidoreductase [unclassified Streptococcus]MBF0806559.1 SDR family NAD(P)-dependent oxidoreductase [Streptococcus sp. 19428wA2_WM07]TFU27363.1 SDR family NAD(P)-dependent oxidoreductase [Streptococcus sp. WM07]